MKITLRSLYKDLEKVNGRKKSLKRTSFGVKSTKKLYTQKKSKTKSTIITISKAIIIGIII